MKSRLTGKRNKTIILVSLAAVLLLAWIPDIDSYAGDQVDEGLQRALISFASARALNAAISVAQGTEASIEPAGVGFTFTPGEVLDPVNDLVEKFSDLMLLASVSFGVQKILLNIGGFWLVSLGLSIMALIWAQRVFLDLQVPSWTKRLLILLVAIRFALPVITLGSDLIFEHFMAEEYLLSQQSIDSSSNEIEGFNQTAATQNQTQDQSVLDRLRIWSQSINFESPVEALKESADRTIGDIVNLMVIFVLQTLLMPLLILWAIYSLVKRLMRGPLRTPPRAPAPRPSDR